MTPNDAWTNALRRRDFSAARPGCQSCDVMISICINSHNEGPRLRRTVETFHKNLGRHPHEFIIIADEVTDSCADDLENAAPGVRLVVIRNEKRRGCGRCKQQAIAAARGEVLIFLDAHMNVLAGEVYAMARAALDEDAIFTPVIHDIRYDDQWIASDKTKPGIHEIPCVKGMRFEKSQYMKCRDAWIREHHRRDIRMAGVGFAISRITLDKIGGLNVYHGLHGSQERGIALRAFMAKVPVRLFADLILGHEFRAGRPRPKHYKRWKTRDQSLNYWHAYFVVAGDGAFKRILPTLKHKARGGQDVTRQPDVIAERAAFAQLKQRPDEELLDMLGVSSGGTAKAGESCPPLPTERPPATVDAIYGVPIEGLPEEMIARWRAAEKLGAGIVQHPAELARTWTRVQDTKPEALMEIGSESGGALYVYAAACPAGATIVSVDDGRTPKHKATLKRIVDELRKEGFKAHIVFGDSHAEPTKQAALAFLSPDGAQKTPVGFLHIDGDHSEKGALKDWGDYAPLVRKNGLIAVHDIAMSPVRKAWEQIKTQADRRYLRDVNSGPFGDHQAMGIGLVRVPPESAGPSVTIRGGSGITLPVSPTPKIDVRIAFEPGGQIGADYNRIMRESPHEWVLFLDHDVLLLHPSWYQVAQEAIRSHPEAGIFTCWTNNIACKHQKDRGAPAGHDIEAHRARAWELWNKYGMKCSHNRRWLIGGFFMLTSKAAWRKAGGFPEDGFFGVDNEYHRRIMRAGLTCWRIDGLYCYHIRDRKDRSWAGGVPTSAEFARNRSLIELERSKPFKEEEPVIPVMPKKRESPKGRKCVYTVLTGGYDRLLASRCVAHGWDFIAFVDDPAAVNSPHWQIRKLDVGDYDRQAASRLPKILPHRFLAEYDFSLYIDANMRLRGELDRLGDRTNWPVFSSVNHPWRSCVYTELRQIANLAKAPVASANAQIARYETEGVPGDLGLFENGFLLRQHMNPAALAIAESWWAEFIRSETRRDQPALAVALWRLQRKIESISCTERTRWVRLLPHRPKTEAAAVA